MDKVVFVKRSIERHGNKAYSYEHVPDKVDIICPEHAIIDEFEYFKVWNADIPNLNIGTTTQNRF